MSRVIRTACHGKPTGERQVENLRRNQGLEHDRL